MQRTNSDRHDNARFDENGEDWSQASAGQSGGSQGLSRYADAAAESVEDLADSGQALEADVISGVEEAADHPERPVRTHEDSRRPDSIPFPGGAPFDDVT